MQPSLFKNLRLQTYLQVINSIIPLIIAPYISRVLGANNIGIFSSHHAIASFFTLFAVFGMGSYGTRCIAGENNENKQKELFVELYFLQLITCCIASICYLCYCLFFVTNKVMAFLQFITLFGCFIDISWLYFGIEDFEFVVITNTLCRVLSLFILFVFVKSKNDLITYTIIMLGSVFINQLILWLEVLRKGYLGFIRIKREKIREHIIPNVILFVPTIAMTVCNSTDKAMLGILSTYDQAGFYANTDRIINVPFSLFLGIGTVFLPRMTFLYKNNQKIAKEFFFDTLSGITMIGVALSFGIIAVSQYFIPLFFGPGFEPCVSLVKVLSFVVIIKSISNAIRMHFLIPFNKEKIYIIATLIGSFLNIILNYLLIPKHGALGATLTTLISECVVLIIQIICVFSIQELYGSIVDLIVYLCIGYVMMCVLNYINYVYFNSFVRIIVNVIVGVIIYSSMTILFWKISNNRLYVIYIKTKIDYLINYVKNRKWF